MNVLKDAATLLLCILGLGLLFQSWAWLPLLLRWALLR